MLYGLVEGTLEMVLAPLTEENYFQKLGISEHDENWKVDHKRITDAVTCILNDADKLEGDNTSTFSVKNAQDQFTKNFSERIQLLKSDVDNSINRAKARAALQHPVALPLAHHVGEFSKEQLSRNVHGAKYVDRQKEDPKQGDVKENTAEPVPVRKKFVFPRREEKKELLPTEAPDRQVENKAANPVLATTTASSTTTTALSVEKSTSDRIVPNANQKRIFPIVTEEKKEAAASSLRETHSATAHMVTAVHEKKSGKRRVCCGLGIGAITVVIVGLAARYLSYINKN
jgi:hypothetical protein